MVLTTYKWNLRRYHQAIDAGIFDDDRPIELLDGELIVMPPEREAHAYHNSEMGDYLRDRLGRRAKIRESHPITLADDSEPCPDLAICQPLGQTYRDRHPSPDNIYWIVEFSNATLEKDLHQKKELYGRSGILEYWVVDLKNRQLHRFIDLEDSEYTTEQILTEGTVSPLAFPDLKIEVGRFLR